MKTYVLRNIHTGMLVGGFVSESLMKEFVKGKNDLIVDEVEVNETPEPKPAHGPPHIVFVTVQAEFQAYSKEYSLVPVDEMPRALHERVRARLVEVFSPNVSEPRLVCGNVVDEEGREIVTEDNRINTEVLPQEDHVAQDEAAGDDQ